MVVFTCSWVVPVSGAPIRSGAVGVEGGRVVWVGRAGAGSQPAGERRDLGAGVLMPGLVNAHCHLELSHMAGRVPYEGGFVSWVEALVACRGQAGEQERDAATAAAVRSLEERGTVAVGDVSNAVGHVELLARSKLDAVVF